MVERCQNHWSQKEEQGAGGSVDKIRKTPVDMRHFGVKVQAEDEKQDACDNEGTAADKLKEVDAGTGRAHHYGLNANERNKSQDHFDYF